jgi:CRP/FNR family cyclic AMP-dependent transcriptional regulator
MTIHFLVKRFSLKQPAYATEVPLAKEKPERARLANMLGSVPLFSGLEKKDLEEIAGIGKEVTFEAGRTILKQGEPGIGFLLILEGKAEVRRKGKVVAILGPGGFFGEMSVIDDSPRSADVVAIEPTRCFGVTAWSFTPMLRSNPSIAIGIITELVRRLRSVEESTDN